MSSVRLDPRVKEKMRKVAAMKGLTLSQLHRLALEDYCDREIAETGPGRYSDVIGVGEGPSELSERSSEVFCDLVNDKHDRHPD
jgi:hypothetical protein